MADTDPSSRRIVMLTGMALERVRVQRLGAGPEGWDWGSEATVKAWWEIVSRHRLNSIVKSPVGTWTGLCGSVDNHDGSLRQRAAGTCHGLLAEP